MRFVITKMFMRDKVTGDLTAATITLQRDDGQMRRLTGKIGTPGCNGFYPTEVKGTGDLIVGVAIGATFAIEPAE